MVVAVVLVAEQAGTGLAAAQTGIAQARDAKDAGSPASTGAPAGTTLAPPAADQLRANAPYGPSLPRDLPPVARPDERPPGIAPALFQAVESATSDYPGIASRKAAARASALDVRAAKSQRLPSLGVQGVALGTGRGLGSQIVVDQPLFSFGRIGSNIERAKAQRVVREAEVDESVRSIALDTISAYFDIARLAERAVILQSTVDEQRQLVDSIGRRVEQEVSPLVDLELARSRLAQGQQELALTLSQRDAALARLEQLVGNTRIDLGFVPTYDAVAHHPDPANAVEQAIACSPQRDRLIAEASVARAEARQAKAAILPQLSAQFSYNNIIGPRAGLGVSAQTQGGLGGFQNASAARLRQSSAEITITTAERELRERVRTDLVENAAAKARIESSASATLSTQNVTESFKRQYLAGRRTWLDVMNAVREASAARLGESDARFSAMASSARLLINTCRWQPQARQAETLR